VSSAASRHVQNLALGQTNSLPPCRPHSNTYQDALKLLASGRLPNVAKLVTTRVPLAEATKAFETLIKGKDDEGNMVLKIVSLMSRLMIGPPN
jgi:threonine dehydrogenase-like Zn-dependent dehydrogenase